MSYFTGTANGTNDLLDIIKTNALAEGYTLNRDRVEGSPNSRELFLTAPNGAVIGFKRYIVSNANGTNPDTEDNDNLALNLSNQYDDLATFWNQPNSRVLNDGSDTGCWGRNIDIKYHLSITAGRIFCAYFLEEYLLTFYAGDFYPYDTPVNYPNPLFLSGNCQFDATQDIIKEFYGRNIIGNNSYKTSAYDNFGNWIHLDGTNNWTSTSYRICLLPFNDSTNRAQEIMRAKDGSIVFYPVTLVNQDTGYMLGELDGVFYVPGEYIRSGDIINDGVNDYLVFDSYPFETNSDYNKFALKLI